MSFDFDRVIFRKRKMSKAFTRIYMDITTEANERLEKIAYELKTSKKQVVESLIEVHAKRMLKTLKTAVKRKQNDV